MARAATARKAKAARVLVAGKSWTTHSIHIKGYDSFETSS